jgi:hypothetical protein
MLFSILLWSVILRERAESLSAVFLFAVAVVASLLAGEDGLRSKHGEGALFLCPSLYKVTANRKKAKAFKNPVSFAATPF